jgi:hypothetical protein
LQKKNSENTVEKDKRSECGLIEKKIDCDLYGNEENYEKGERRSKGIFSVIFRKIQIGQ